VVIDFATLTAAVRAALGPRYAAVLSNDAVLARDLIAAGAATGENLWQLPLVDEYRRDLDSLIADLKNTVEGHSGTIIGALFLREFTAGLRWAHIDFSSTAVTEKPFPGHPRGASGFGVRLALQYLLDLPAAQRRFSRS
jgi:leucyl aminopeptidase